MKRSVCILVFLSFLILPIKISAATINNVVINSNGTVKSGEQIVVTLTASISNYNQSEGIWLAYTNLTYDMSHLALVKITSPGYETVTQYNDNGVELVSVAIENSKAGNPCVNGLLQCGNFVLSLNFQATNVVSAMDTAIVMSEFGIGTLAITVDREYTLDDIDERDYNRTVSHDLKLQANTNPEQEKKPVIVTEKQANTNTSKKTSEKPVVATKSNNNYLKALEIIDYPINFNKDNTEYTVNVNTDLTTLKINLAVEDNKSSYKINGNENLVNNSVVTVTVTAEDGTTKNYKINIKKTNATNENETKIQTTNDKKEKSDIIIKKVIIGLTIIIGLFVIICLICIINGIRDKRKLDKMIKNEK